MVADVGDRENAQVWGAAAACRIVSALVATVIDPCRAVPPFDCTLNLTEPLPDPDAAPLIVMNDALLLALHAQPAATLTLAVNSPPFASTGPVGAPLTEYEQLDAGFGLGDGDVGFLLSHPTEAASATTTAINLGFRCLRRLLDR
jgi:hypothetical protein